MRGAVPLLRPLGQSVATTLLLALVATGSGAAGALPGGAVAHAVSRSTEAVSLPPVKLEVRVRQAAEARLSEQATAYAAARRAEALSLAGAAIRAARGAEDVAQRTGDTELLQTLEAAADALVGVRAAGWRIPVSPAGAPKPDGGAAATAATTTAADLVAAQELEEQASAVFALAFAAESLTETSVAELSRVPLAELAGLDAAVSAAEETAAEVVLEPLVPLEPTTELEPAVDWLPTGDLTFGYGDTAGYTNGAIPLDVLCAPDSSPQELLQCDAAAAFDLLSARYLQDNGRPLALVSSYRTFERQVEVKRLRGSLAATPGTSLHGLGIAIDLADAGGVGQFDTPVYLWMKANAAEFGWVHPAAMEPGGSGPQEPWHWEFRG